MAKLTVVSGVGGKLPAAFLFEIEGRRLLLDLGEGPEPGVLPDVTGLGRLDAICLSHAHMDHAGALQLAASLGDPPVYATAATFAQLSPESLAPDRRRLLPLRGEADIEGIAVTLGRNGHAPGGIWFHFPADGGFLYTGDWSAESILLPFDPPPPATVLLTDASYGDRDMSLGDQIEAIAASARGGAVLPVPSGGRGPEMALVLGMHGLSPRLCPQIRVEMADLAADSADIIGLQQRRGLAGFLAQGDDGRPWHPTDIIIAAEANGEAGLSAELIRRRQEGFHFIFSGHVPPGTPASALLAEKAAQWLPWNVHPRLRDVLQLAETTGARQVIPAFARLDTMPGLTHALGERLWLERVVEFGAGGQT